MDAAPVARHWLAPTSRLAGQIFTHDPFKTGKPVTLNAERTATLSAAKS